MFQLRRSPGEELRVPWGVPRHEVSGLPVRDDGEAGVGAGVDAVVRGVVGVPMGQHERADRLVRPAPDVLDVLPRARGQEPRVDDERRPVTDDHRDVRFGEIGQRVRVADEVDARPEILDSTLRRALVRSRGRAGQEEGDERSQHQSASTGSEAGRLADAATGLIRAAARCVLCR